MNDSHAVEKFAERWSDSGANERANYQLFLSELCDIIGVERPEPSSASDAFNDYVFERAVDMRRPDGTTSKGRLDLYRKGCFVLEAKQGVEAKSKPTDPAQLTLLGDVPRQNRTGHGVRGTSTWAASMLSAKGQAERYAKALPEWPPFLIIVDVGHVIELWADFSLSGKNYAHFPDAKRFRIPMEDLRKQEIRDLLRTVWTDPLSLDPSLVTAKVTREIATHLAALGKSFEQDGHPSDTVARFLMRALFTMFAEDVGLIPEASFTDLLIAARGRPESFKPLAEELWATMDKGGFSTALRADLLRFNGGLFKECEALPVRAEQLSLLIEASERDWRNVEPAIFGTLLERALDKRQRHKLGAHYTPRAYVERLIFPALMEPLRKDWEAVKAEALIHAGKGDSKKALEAVKDFHGQLCELRVLDPACGSGNFLYVAMEQMKRLEGEVTDLLAELGEKQIGLMLEGATVDPHQFLGIELNPWAASVAELVLWIGYLQWHYRTYGRAAPSEPVLRDFHNIEHRDAVLEYEGRTPRMDEQGEPVTIWDGITTKLHPVTGEAVPDGAARIPVYDYAKPKPAKWPHADFIIGNPPFIGASRMRDALGSGYVEALWDAYPKMPQSADLVMFWWHKAAAAVRAYTGKGKGARRLGLITTNSIRQTFNRRVLAEHMEDKKPLSLTFAIPDHPWVDAGDGAAVRVAMTVAKKGSDTGTLAMVTREEKSASESLGYLVTLEQQQGKIFPNLRIGADVGSAVELQANDGLSSRGMMLFGSGFIVTPQAAKLLGLGTVQELEKHIRPYRNGRDLTQTSRDVMVIDFFGLSEAEAQKRFPAAYQHTLDNVKPERDENRDKWLRQNWWVHGRPRTEIRPALEDLNRYIVTVETMKHRVFQFLDKEVLPDNKLIVLALADAENLAVLSSSVHLIWTDAQGTLLEDRPVYPKSQCFDPFPFPEMTETQRATLRDLGEQLDAHRKARQAEHSKLTLTQMYNVLEKLRAGEVIEGKDKQIYDDGLIGVLKDIHERIDAATADAYGWPVDLSDDDILHRLVALNHDRAAEEARGHIRWLRPDYQNPDGQTATTGETGTMDLGEIAPVAAQTVWPKTMPEQITLVRGTLETLDAPVTADEMARLFKGRNTPTKISNVQDILASLTALGHAVEESGRFIG